MTDDTKAKWLVGSILGTVAVLLFGCFFKMGESERRREVENAAKRQALFSGWSKTSGITNLTFAEWDALERSRMLPGQMSPTEARARQNDSGNAILETATGVFLGNAAGKLLR
jgi:hypothetical protein